MLEALAAQFEELQEQLEILKDEHIKFVNGNKSAGTRARKAALAIKNTAHSYRATVSEIKSNNKK